MWKSSQTLRTLSVLGFLIAALGLSACSATTTIMQSGSCSSRVAVTYSGPAERAYCSTSTSYTGATTVLTGSAVYKARIRNAAATSDTYRGLTDVSADRPIRWAELEVLDSSGKRVQCGTTALDGSFSLTVPTGTADLTVRVNSRSNDATKLRASVMNCPEENGVYSVSSTFTPTGTPSVTLRADVDGEILGGAFNILDQLYSANEFLRTRVGDCGGIPTDECTRITTSLANSAPKVKAYWAKGFNPNNYFGSSSAVSFYIPGTSRLFILGGEDGDTQTADTDHFDNSVIIHEYGHFIEDMYTISNSPGGSHSGLRTVDSRLAWSEGWGNFFQGAVQNSPYYIDTRGYATSYVPGQNGAIFAIPIELNNTVGSPYRSYCTSNTNGCDKPVNPGEGNFREFSVTRFLWDVADGTTGNTDVNSDPVNNQFLDVWKAITSKTGLNKPTEEFRAIGLLHEYVEAVNPTEEANYSSLRATHSHGLTDQYAQYVERRTVSSGACTATKTVSMTPYLDGSDQGDFATSVQSANNDFFYYNHPGGTFNIKLTYQTTDSVSGTESDLDLFVYNTKARYGNANDMKLIAQTYFDGDASTPEIEQASKSLPAGKYLINVKVYTGQNTSGQTIGTYAPNDLIDPGSPLTYTLMINGDDVCPQPRP